MNNELDISPRKQQLKEEYERLQQVYSMRNCACNMTLLC